MDPEEQLWNDLHIKLDLVEQEIIRLKAMDKSVGIIEMLKNKCNEYKEIDSQLTCIFLDRSADPASLVEGVHYFIPHKPAH